MPRIPVDTDLPIHFASTFVEADWRDVQRPTLVLVPDSSGWNDFLTHFRALMHFVGFAERHPVLELRVMFPGDSSTARKLEKVLAGRRHAAVDEVEEPFVTILANTAGYRTLVARLGFSDAFAALRRMRDIVVVELEGVDHETMSLAQGLDFTQGVLREDDTWAAFRQGGRYLTPHGAPDVDDAAHSFEVSVRLEGIPGRHILDADFGVDFPLSRRVLVIVGENGVGKTRFLEAMIGGLQLAPAWAPDMDAPVASFSPRPRFSRLLVFSSTTSDPYPVSVFPWLGLDYRFHRMLGTPPGAGDVLARSLLDTDRSEGEVESLGGRRGVDLLREMLDPLGITDNLHVEVTAGDGTDALPQPTRVGDRLYLPFFGVRGEQRRLMLQARMIQDASPQVVLGPGRARSLSSGEQVLLRFATQAIGSLRPGTMFLLDEPETHLHPHYVSLFMSMLDRLLELSGSIALIATHSAYIVREVPARRVRIAGRDSQGEVSIEPPRMQTFGASIDTISQFVFGDVSTRHRFQTVLDRWLEERPNATLDEFREQFREDLNVETLSYFAQRIEEQRSS